MKRELKWMHSAAMPTALLALSLIAAAWFRYPPPNPPPVKLLNGAVVDLGDRYCGDRIAGDLVAVNESTRPVTLERINRY